MLRCPLQFPCDSGWTFWASYVILHIQMEFCSILECYNPLFYTHIYIYIHSSSLVGAALRYLTSVLSCLPLLVLHPDTSGSSRILFLPHVIFVQFLFHQRRFTRHCGNKKMEIKKTKKCCCLRHRPEGLIEAFSDYLRPQLNVNVCIERIFHTLSVLCVQSRFDSEQACGLSIGRMGFLSNE